MRIINSTQNHLTTNVFDAARQRIDFVYDECDDVIVTMSGGKDSTVLFELTKIAANERGRLPLKVMWLDQEAEWQATGDYMSSVMRSDDVEPYWFQIPFNLRNCMSFTDTFLSCWNPEQRASWIREQADISIKDNPTAYDRFHPLMNWLPTYCSGGKHVAVLSGMRISESQNRKMRICYRKANYKGVTWCRVMTGNTRVFWPLYDFQDQDIWAAIGRNGYRYNAIYDKFYQYGIQQKRMRVSALIHETAWHNIRQLQELEPETYNRFLNRICGVNCFSHLIDDITPCKLPVFFKNWKEYRDYLLDTLIEPENRPVFVGRWRSQHGELWYKAHVREVVVNDIDGTKNANSRAAIGIQYKKKRYRAKLIDTVNRGSVAGT